MFLALIGDLHFRGDKLSELESAWEQAVDYTLENNIKTLFILGDVFDSPNIATHKTSVGTIVKAFNKHLLRLVDKDVQVFIIEGNHDQAGAYQESSLQYLKGINKNVYVIDRPTTIKVPNSNYTIGVLPWISQKIVQGADFYQGVKNLVTTTLEDFKKDKISLLLGHVELEGYQLKTYRILGNHYALQLKELLNTCPNLIFGHIHQADKYYAGSLTQLTFGDVGNPQGFIVYDTDTNTSKRIKVAVPEYKILHINSVEEIPKELDTFNHYRLDIKSTIPVSEVSHLLAGRDVRIRIIKEDDSLSSLEIDRTLSLKEEDLFEMWMGIKKLENPDKERLREKFKVLKEVR